MAGTIQTLLTSTILPTGTCRYCAETVEAEYEPEDGSWYVPAAHFGCVQIQKDGPFYVRTVQNAATPPRVSVRRYGSRLRAQEEARQIREWNRRDWPCGARLDIFVGEGEAPQS